MTTWNFPIDCKFQFWQPVSLKGQRRSKPLRSIASPVETIPLCIKYVRSCRHRSVIMGGKRKFRRLKPIVQIWRPISSETLRMYPQPLYRWKAEFMPYICAVESMGLSAFISMWWAPKDIYCENRELWCYCGSRSSKVVGFGTNRKGDVNFLLMFLSNYSVILDRLGDMSR